MSTLDIQTFFYPNRADSSLTRCWYSDLADAVNVNKVQKAAVSWIFIMADWEAGSDDWQRQ